MRIRAATGEDTVGLLAVERAAFGQDSEAELVRELLDDRTAQPLVSLVAEEDGVIVGHILLTRAAVEARESDTSGPGAATEEAVTRAEPAAAREPAGSREGVETMVLGPLAVAPSAQGQGVGTQLVETALDEARRLGVGLVFLLGHPDYYPRFGFRPAGSLGFDAPHPIPDEHEDAWMVLDLAGDSIGVVRGTVVPAQVFRRPEHWRE